ncbi:hypothetical protein [Ramlibacter sp. 2FC]|uniref:hypothetical protein n=1 Tax=Ramlibacter sp. 2FC TaxID=2502188 RepID=UPI0010F571C2|nr:hypothetical protein [Ramlibacter sp. 2FC]
MLRERFASTTDVVNVASVPALVNALMLFRTSRPVFERRVMPPTQSSSLPAIRDALVGVFAANGVLRLAMMVAGERFSVSAVWLCVEAAPLVLLQTRWMARRPPPFEPPTVRRVVCVLLLLVSTGLVVPALRALLASA